MDKERADDMGTQAMSAISILGEFLILFIRTTYEFIMSIVKLALPVQEKSVKGEIVLITGTGHGIGKELALQFASSGATVVCWDINKQNNEQTVKDINDFGYSKAYSYECDVTNRQQILEVAEKVKKDIGTVTILVNNAGIMPCHPLKEHTEQEIRKIFEINVLAHFWMFEAFLPGMLAANKGHIVALSSMAGIVGLPNLVPYCASKFAVRGMMEALHEELRETIPNTKIQFTTIYPYMVDTGLCKNPRIRFKNQFNLVPPKEAAKKIIQTVRRNIQEASIPEYMFHLNGILRLYPYKVAMLLKDFLGMGLDSDKK